MRLCYQHHHHYEQNRGYYHNYCSSAMTSTNNITVLNISRSINLSAAGLQRNQSCPVTTQAKLVFRALMTGMVSERAD
jgi:hypothetical protein